MKSKLIALALFAAAGTALATLNLSGNYSLWSDGQTAQVRLDGTPAAALYEQLLRQSGVAMICLDGSTLVESEALVCQRHTTGQTRCFFDVDESGRHRKPQLCPQQSIIGVDNGDGDGEVN